MEVLLVDDEIYTIRILQTTINWQSHGVVQVWSALGAARAREIMKEHAVDLVICDIEMPRENGLDFLAWIRENRYDTEMILLTCHTDFSYAKQALSLGVYDYCVKPIIVEDVEKVIAEALVHIQEKRKMRKAWEEKDYLERRRRIVDRNFWRNTLEGRNGSSPGELLKQAEENNILLELDDTFSMALFSAKFVEHKAEAGWMDYVRITQEYFDQTDPKTVLVENTSHDKWTVLMRNYQEADFRSLCMDYLSWQRKERKLRLIGCYQAGLYCEELSRAYQKLNETEKMMTFYQENLWDVCQSGQEKMADAELTADMEQMLYSGNFEGFAEKMDAYLHKTQWKHPISIAALYTLRADICQSLDVYLKGRGISAHTLFLNEELCTKMNEATVSAEHMMRFVHCLARIVPYENDVTDITNAVKKYIFQHLSEDIVRDSIAEALYMNVDYIARVFKRDTGMSITQYINKERISQAKLLIMASDMPMGDVAGAVGYSNFSYFSKMFKQYESCTPREYKLRIKKTAGPQT